VTAERRESAGYLKSEYLLSERRACEAVLISRRVFRYVPREKSDAEVTDALGRLAGEHPDLGFGKFFELLRADGHVWNHKRVHRVYSEMGLNKRRKHKRRLPPRQPEPLKVPPQTNKSWSADFMSDALGDGRRFRTFNVIDDHNREVLAIEIDLNLGSRRVIRVLDRLAETRGLPERIRFDNGPEFTSIAVADWAEQNCVELDFIKPGRPMQNGFIERFNRTYRQAILDMYIFENLDEVRELTDRWIDFYNHRRPHDSLGGSPPRSSCGHVPSNSKTPV
jgi:putative transposase